MMVVVPWWGSVWLWRWWWCHDGGGAMVGFSVFVLLLVSMLVQYGGVDGCDGGDGGGGGSAMVGFSVLFVAVVVLMGISVMVLLVALLFK